MDAYYVMRLGKEEGPYTFADLQQMVQQRQIDGNAQIRQQEGAWFAASNLTGLFSDKEWVTALLLSLFLGSLGIDRFYLGHSGLGVLKLLTCGGVGVWSLVDVVLIAMNRMTDGEGRPLKR
jgi:TM2 domain-containing membrane protein YozV